MDQALRTGNGIRVLVAEDEPLAAMVVEDVLTELGYEVLLASDGVEALHLAERHAFDVLVTDLAMPRMTGWDLIPRLRLQRPDLPVVVMTGFLPPNGRELLISTQGGPLGLVLKPFEIRHLVTAIEKVTGQQQAEVRPTQNQAAALLSMY
ncbi:response regulator [Belnapia rosea]|uniref:Response regulator receiver domain-containing protein n=1 Tax=Belnapia rosea TaxID=938405 RepID=A0A1G6J142_9PROT|nr:response regulator [Belnapia rosea]SDB09343.1 Response regulator receiver domain-containing protein [Belnapia rosea]SDC12447.1 Response regulator receiver domain-containing protein [Belnapia rosea]